jgi:hypothetical protein
MLVTLARRAVVAAISVPCLATAPFGRPEPLWAFLRNANNLLRDHGRRAVVVRLGPVRGRRVRHQSAPHHSGAALSPLRIALDVAYGAR